MTPATSKYWLLDSVAGWRTSTRSGISFSAADGDLILDPLPGDVATLPASLACGLQCPVALAAGPAGCLFVLDAATGQLIVLDLTAKPRPLPMVFDRPAGVAILPGGEIAVADPVNMQVRIFSARPHVLLRVVPVEKPVAVASDRCGILYILDRGSGSILRVRIGGESLAPRGAGVLVRPSQLAVTQDGTVAVVDGTAIVVFPSTGGTAVRLTQVHAPLCLAFDDAGNLFVGTADGLVAKLEPDVSALEGYRLGGEGVADPDSAVASLAWSPEHGLAVILKNPDLAVPPRLAILNPAGAFRLLGTFATQPLDSGIENCQWHRVQILGSVPPGTSLLVESATSEARDGDFGRTAACVLAGADNPDCLVQSRPGRYLRLKLTLRSNGANTPRLYAIKVFFPRDGYLQYLPAVFQEDEESRRFLERFLAIFETSFDEYDRRIDNVWQLFDPFAIDEKYFPWLAAWLALPLDPAMTLQSKRTLLQEAFRSYLLRGTVAGLQQAIEAYSGVSGVRILEHFRLRNWAQLSQDAGLDQGARLWSRNLYARLQVGVNSRIGAFRLTNAPEPMMEPFAWGANQFSVLFPAHPYRAAEVTARVRPIVAREKPAHTQALLCPLHPRLRVGVQATLDVDAYVGGVDVMVLGRLATLGYDAVLSCSPLAREIRALGQSPKPRVGVDATIL